MSTPSELYQCHSVETYLLITTCRFRYNTHFYLQVVTPSGTRALPHLILTSTQITTPPHDFHSSIEETKLCRRRGRHAGKHQQSASTCP